jgi:hypothetical protein
MLHAACTVLFLVACHICYSIGYRRGMMDGWDRWETDDTWVDIK